MAVAGAGAGAEIIVKVGAGTENKLFRLRNTGTLLYSVTVESGRKNIQIMSCPSGSRALLSGTIVYYL